MDNQDGSWIKIILKLHWVLRIVPICYDPKPLEWGTRLNPCIRVNTRELNRELFTK